MNSIVIPTAIKITLELSKMINKPAERSKIVIEIKKRLGLDPIHPLPDFVNVYNYTLVEYGTGKSRSLLELFETKEVQNAFRDSYNSGDSAIVYTQIKKSIEQLKVGDEVKKLNIDIDVETNEIINTFNDVIDRTRTPKEARLECKVDSLIEMRTEQIVESQISKQSQLTPQIAESISADDEYHDEVDYSRELISQLKPHSAKEYLIGLKQRLWNKCSDRIKFRILNNLGVAKFNIGEEQEAAQLFLEAYQYNPEDEKAISNRALGHLILKQQDDAEKFSKITLDKNPINHQALSVLLQSAPQDASLNSVIERVDKAYRQMPEIAFIISQIARRKDNLDEALYWAKVAYDNDPEGIPDILANYANCMQERNIKDNLAVLVGHLSNDFNETTNRAIELLNTAWDKVKETEINRNFAWWLSNIATWKLFINDKDGALNLINVAIALNPNEPWIIRHQAHIAIGAENDDIKAEKLFRIIQDNKKTPDARVSLAKILYIRGELKEAIELLESKLIDEMPDDLKFEAYRFLLQLYVDNNNTDKANELLENIYINEKGIQYFIDKAKITSKEDLHESEILLKNAKQFINDRSPVSSIIELGELFFERKQYQNVIDVYTFIVDISVISSITERLTLSFYWNGDIGKAFDICKEIRENHGVREPYTNIELELLAKIGDVQTAKDVFTDFLSKYPENNVIRINEAFNNYQLESYTELDNLLTTEISLENIPKYAVFNLSYLMMVRGFDDKALRIMYELRRKEYNDPEVHMAYIGRMLLRDKENDILLAVNKVEIDSAVLLKDNVGKERWYIIENREDYIAQSGELSPDSPLATRLLDKEIGDRIALQDNQYAKIEAEITNIQSKFVHALQDSIDVKKKQFPDHPGFWEIPISDTRQESELPKGLDIILEESDRRHKHASILEDLYRNRNITIGELADSIGADIHNVWQNLATKPELGVICCHGVNIPNVINSLKNTDKSLVIDLISILTLMRLKLNVSPIIDKFGKFRIAQSTVDYVREKIFEITCLKSKGYMIICKDGSNYIRHEITPEIIKSEIDTLDQILDWIRSHCTITPCYEYLKFNNTQMESLGKRIGKQFLESILLAKDQILYSDDGILSNIARHLFGVKSVWTQAVYDSLNRYEIISKADYEDVSINLAIANYNHTSITSDMLVETVKRADWKPESPYSDTIRRLSECNADSAIQVAVEFMIKLEQTKILPRNPDHLELVLIDTLLVKRRRQVVLDRFRETINRLAASQLRIKQNLLRIINDWEKTHIRGIR